MQKNNKAFTLVELIVVITILAILGTIAFINLQGYSTSARDGKRVSDINNIMKKIGIETSKGTSISSLINTTKTNSGLTINGNTGSSIQGTANFATLKEDGSKFKDPVTKGDYVFSYSVGGSGTGAYKFIQASTVNEELNQAVVKGNYYQMQPSDSPSITVTTVGTTDYYVIDEGVDLPYEIIVGTSENNVVVNSCDTQPIYTNASFTEGTPTSENQLWQNTSNVNPCYYECINGYSGSDCSTAPNSCDTQPIYTNASFTVGTPTTQNQVWQNTNNSNPCYYECINGYTGSDCSIAPLTGWRALDPNCDIEDLPIGTQIWAGCNSILGTGIEYSVNQNCYNYQGGVTTGCNRSSSEKENVYNSTYGVDNIWGKLYTWVNSPSACPTGRHVPSNTEWTVLTNYIITQNGGGNTIGWSAQSGKNETNNLVKALKIPLAGNRGAASAFYNRGYSAYFWSSTPYSADAYFRIMRWYSSTVDTSHDVQSNGFSVRCIKD